MVKYLILMRFKIFWALLSSVLLLASFYWLPGLIFISFVPLLFVCREPKETFGLGFISGFVFAAGLLYWILVLEVPMKTWLWLGFLLLLIYFGLVFGVSLLLSNYLRGLFLLPFVWTAIEFLRSLSPEIGFPWGSVGYAITSYLPLIQLAEFTGLPGITFLIMLVNVLIFYAIKEKKVSHIISVAIITGCIYFHGKVVLNKKEPTGVVCVGIVQPNILPEAKRWEILEYRLPKFYRLSKRLGSCDLLIWPETAIPGYLGLNDQTEKMICKVVDSLGIPVVMGATRFEFSRGTSKTYNSSFFVVPKYGIKGYHDKIYLVPFGERLPFDEMFPALQKLNFGQGNFTPGKEYKVFEISKAKFSTLICFESIFPRISRKFVRQGAEFLVNITDDSWFGRTPGPYQHAQQAILRAIEYRISVVRCGNTGISFFVTPKGEVKEETKIFTQRVFKLNIPTRKGLTLYARLGDWFAWLCVGLTFWLLNLRLMLKKEFYIKKKRSTD